MTGSETRAAPARLGWLIATVGMAAILVIGSWLNYRVVRAAVDTLNLGQSELLGNAVRTFRRDPYGGVDAAALQEILDTHAASGLRYLAVLGPGDSILAQAGMPLEPVVAPRSGGPGPTVTLIPVGERIRAFHPRPPVRSRRDGGGERGDSLRARGDSAPPRWDSMPDPRTQGGDRRSPGARDQSGRDPFSWITYWTVIEFEPLAADVLAGGRRSLGLSVLAAVLLVFLALLSWRASERHEAARRTLEEQQHLAVLGQMSAVLAHEIRNPLASLKGNAQLVAEHLPQDSPDRKRVARVVSEAHRLEVLTADLLDFARTGPLQRSKVDPAEMLRQLMEDVGGGPFELDVQGSVGVWPLDVARIRQALLNVLMNARQASGDGVVRIRLDASSDRLVLEVHDSGGGLPEGEEDRIFEPFFTTRTNGTGLGLAVARNAVERHGGVIQAFNGPGGGAVFRITLPAQERT